ncbi:hypothetical protein [Nocardia sp. N2S4-5]|uniref:hypothetical protein n=1 Tax=Nocardia sp. N2S4-5 TaxID=3351565 RepID=UPI0037D1B17F
MPTFEVNYNAFSFPAAIAPHGSMTFSADELAHAMFTAGRAPGDRFGHGGASLWEFLHRSAVIPAYIRRRPHGGLTRSRLAHELDRSELVGLSYALGTAMTDIFCRQVLHVDHLLHIDRYWSTYGMRFRAGRKRADYIGRSPAGWIVAEAKGRSRGMERALRGKLVDQKRSVLSIESAPPSLALGCVAHFPGAGENLVVDAFDPDESAEDAIRIDDLTIDRYLYSYYAPFVEALNLGQPYVADSGIQMEAVDFGVFGLRVSLLQGIADLTRSIPTDDLAGFGERVYAITTSATDIGAQIRSDGSIISTDWADVVQRRDWDVG